MPQIHFLPQNQIVEFQIGDSVLEIAEKNKVEILHTCGGLARCADCKIKIVETAQKLKRPESEEISIIGNTYFITKERLSCQLRPEADLKVEIEKPYWTQIS